MVLWLELPEGLVVGQAAVMPEDLDGAVGRVLRTALTVPLVGAPRRPDAIRVDDPVSADEVRAAIDGTIPVTVAPVPELDEVFNHLVESMPPGDADESYLADSRVSPAAVERLFTAARGLFATAPWSIAADVQVLRMDVPALDVEGACLSILGQATGRHGVLIFPSLDGFEAFMDAAGDLEDGQIDLGSGWLALMYERAADLPPAMRREAMTHGWPVESPDAYPVVERRDPDGVLRPLVERDVEIAAACARSLGAFILKYAATFSSDTFTPVCESYFDEDDQEVRFTVPYEAYADVDLSDPVDDLRADMEFDVALAPEPAPVAPFRPRVARNAPCPCGSGRKYKKCCLPDDEAQHADRQRAPAIHESDERLVARLTRFAMREFGAAWASFREDFRSLREAVPLAAPWSVYNFEVDGRTAVEAYLERHGHRCTADERAWLNAQRAAWLSVWEVVAVDPGKTVKLRDLLSDVQRTVQEKRGSRTLVPRDTILARVVDHEGISLLCGMHPRPLSPVGAAEVVRYTGRRLQRRGTVPIDRLRDPAVGSYLIRHWEDAVDVADAQRAAPPQFCNQDGDPLLPTTDHFDVTPGAAAAVEARVAALDGAERGETIEDRTEYAFLRPHDPPHPDGEQAVIGHVRVEPTVLRLETNSVTRADALRARIETACGTRIRHRAREHTDPQALLKDREERPPPPAPGSPEARAVAEFKRRHYARWLDQPLPALQGRTPRDAARTAAGRAELELVFKQMEHMENHAPGDAPFDFSPLRRELRLDIT
ncbi:MAG: DUF2384 domain-containing protein [Acidobacteria bacterium]|nr:DUF2384 domain-containing protein [Acidobacteriota bacterium]